MTNNSGVISNIGYFYMFWMQVSLYPSFWFFILIISLTHLLIIHNEQKNTIIPLVLLYKNHYTFDVIKLCLYNLYQYSFRSFFCLLCCKILVFNNIQNILYVYIGIFFSFQTTGFFMIGPLKQENIYRYLQIICIST